MSAQLGGSFIEEVAELVQRSDELRRRSHILNANVMQLSQAIAKMNAESRRLVVHDFIASNANDADSAGS